MKDSISLRRYFERCFTDIGGKFMGRVFIFDRKRRVDERFLTNSIDEIILPSDSLDELKFVFGAEKHDNSSKVINIRSGDFYISGDAGYFILLGKNPGNQYYLVGISISHRGRLIAMEELRSLCVDHGENSCAESKLMRIGYVL